MEASFPDRGGRGRAPAPIYQGDDRRGHVQAEATMGEGTKGPRRTRRDGAHAPKGAGARKVRCSFSIDPEARRRILVHAAMTGCEPADLVERFGLGLREFVVQHRGGGAPGGGPVPPAVAAADQLAEPPG